MVLTIPLRSRRRLTVAVTRTGVRTALWCKGDVPLWRDDGEPGAGVRETRWPSPSGTSGAASLSLPE